MKDLLNLYAYKSAAIVLAGIEIVVFMVHVGKSRLTIKSTIRVFRPDNTNYAPVPTANRQIELYTSI